METLNAHIELEKDYQEALRDGKTTNALDYLKDILNYEENEAKSIIIVHKDFLQKFEKKFA